MTLISHFLNIYFKSLILYKSFQMDFNFMARVIEAFQFPFLIRSYVFYCDIPCTNLFHFLRHTLNVDTVLLRKNGVPSHILFHISNTYSHTLRRKPQNTIDPLHYAICLANFFSYSIFVIKLSSATLL